MALPTQLLHRLTSYQPGRSWESAADDPRVVKGLKVNDVSRLPWYYKRYHQGLTRLPLPRDLPETVLPAVAVLAGVATAEPIEVDLVQLSRILHLSAGVTRTAERAFGTYLFRAAGSAGGRFPLELYVAVPEGGLLPPGVHWYDPADHALVTIGPPPGPGRPAFVVTGVPWRTGWRYRERGYRHVYWDAGTMLAQLAAASASAGVGTRLFSRFPDVAVASLVGADRVHEFPVAVVGMGDGPPAIEANGPAIAGDVDASPIEFPLVTAAQRAGEMTSLGPYWDEGRPVEDFVVEPTPIDEVILSRGSQRRMDPQGRLPEAVLRTCLSVGLRGTGIVHYVAVHAVDGLQAGIYRWPDLSAPNRVGPPRAEMYRLCLDQSLGADAAFVVIATARVGDLDDRGYREAQMASGIAEGRIHLLAYALGASASGMTFRDSDVADIVGDRVDGLLLTCVGVPEYPSAPGGPPGLPTRVRSVAPRVGRE